MIYFQLYFQYLALTLIIRNTAIIMCFPGHSCLQLGQNELARSFNVCKQRDYMLISQKIFHYGCLPCKVIFYLPF